MPVNMKSKFHCNLPTIIQKIILIMCECTRIFVLFVLFFQLCFLLWPPFLALSWWKCQLTPASVDIVIDDVLVIKFKTFFSLLHQLWTEKNDIRGTTMR